MWILPLVGYLGSVLGFCFLTLAIASGLYYLSELVEEHTVIAKRLLTRLIYCIIGLQLVLWVVDGLPVLLTLLGVVSHIVYLGNMRRFPFVRLTDPLFLASCVLVLVNHYFWFRHFSDVQQRSYSRLTSMYDQPTVPSFTEIASFFGILNSHPRDDGGKNKRQGMVKVIVDYVLSGIGEISRLAGWKKPEERF
ncbi:hypothetical protein CIB48_g3517 [Xylaria polymorpha]|nr:hypothetical protein CIB48_g3517 [Xylaria polymorpha]